MRAWEYLDRPIVLSHRGGALEFPENSREAFTAMSDAGLRYIETDVQASRDGELVIMHDPFLNRTTDGSGRVCDVDWCDIKNLSDESGQRPVLLREVLDEFPEITFNVDIKGDDGVQPAISLLQDGTYNDRVLLAAFSEKRLRQLRAALPNIATSLGTSAIARLVAATKLGTSARSRLLSTVPGPDQGAVCAQVPLFFRRMSVFNEDFVQVADDHGLDVHVWTLNEVKDMDEALARGARGIVTDRPSLATELISSRHDTSDIEERANSNE